MSISEEYDGKIENVSFVYLMNHRAYLNKIQIRNVQIKSEELKLKVPQSNFLNRWDYGLQKDRTEKQLCPHFCLKCFKNEHPFERVGSKRC